MNRIIYWAVKISRVCKILFYLLSDGGVRSKGECGTTGQVKRIGHVRRLKNGLLCQIVIMNDFVMSP